MCLLLMRRTGSSKWTGESITLKLLLFKCKNLNILKIVVLTGNNFSDFVITCSVYWKMCDKF